MSIEANITELQFKHPKDKDFNTRLHNTKLFLRLWKERVTPEMVIKDLGDWRCGTQACAGGHMSTWKEFHAIGGTTCGMDIGSMPSLEIKDTYIVGALISLFLFGDKDLFNIRGRFVADDNYTYLSDYNLVIKRFEYWINYLENEITKIKTSY